MHKKMWHIYLCPPPQGCQWREKTSSSAGCDWRLESHAPATASAPTTHPSFFYNALSSLDPQTPPMNLDESLWKKISTLFSKYPPWTKVWISLESLLETQTRKSHPGPTMSESEFYQHPYVIPMHIKAWETLERVWNESSCCFLTKGVIQNLKDETVLNVEWMAFPFKDSLRSSES